MRGEGRVVFAGSVVRRDYNWDVLVGRVAGIRNYVGSADWVVGLFPKFFELPGLSTLNPDLGSAGFDGFMRPFARRNNAQVEFVRGGHGAALDPRNRQSIVSYIIEDSFVPPDSSIVVAAHPSWIGLLSRRA